MTYYDPNVGLPVGSYTNPGDAPRNTPPPPPPSPAKANSAATVPSNSAAIRDLMAALNAKQLELVNKKIYEYPDTYSIEFVPEWLGDAKFQKSTAVDLKQTPMGKAGNGVSDPGRLTPDFTMFKRQFDAGESIVNIISRVIQESSYIYNQQSVIIDKNGTPKQNGTPAQSFVWFNIVAVTTPTDKWDNRRKTFAADIKYIVTTYETPVYSEYFPNGLYRGVHKEYNYWFTGENTEVLSFEVQSNNAYWNIINTPSPDLQSRNSSLNTVRQSYSSRSKEADQGAAEKVNDISANAADWLYNARDYASIRFRILGDPAWINTLNFANKNAITTAPFLPDGSINYATSAAYFAFNYNLSDDYNTLTGLQDIIGGAASGEKNYSDNNKTSASFVYTAVESVARFRGGRFEIELEGRLKLNTRSDSQLPERSSTTDPAPVVAGNNAKPAPKTGGPRPTSVTGQAPGTSLAKGTQQILNPPTQLNNPTLPQLQNSPVYIEARRNGVPPAQALELARQAFAAGTNTWGSPNAATPGVSGTSQLINREP